ncbi:hypothetical protein [Edaphobacter albus]|uniref:hypothetical protein n=1 Tax=Edaphobacter sp. 4G125 TaxID=2763071 RepID=UPI0016452E99|nr:hypothetical protein [Edaphobacter sp. 4G125]QNI37497.1 hypothetical protein H7846_04125 [Edaphobacter sp. 4G125]
MKPICVRLRAAFIFVALESRKHLSGHIPLTPYRSICGLVNKQEKIVPVLMHPPGNFLLGWLPLEPSIYRRDELAIAHLYPPESIAGNQEAWEMELGLVAASTDTVSVK